MVICCKGVHITAIFQAYQHVSLTTQNITDIKHIDYIKHITLNIEAYRDVSIFCDMVRYDIDTVLIGVDRRVIGSI